MDLGFRVSKPRQADIVVNLSRHYQKILLKILLQEALQQPSAFHEAVSNGVVNFLTDLALLLRCFVGIRGQLGGVHNIGLGGTLVAL